jgi:fatty acid amide hydrolase 2
MDGLLGRSARQLAELIRTGQTSAVEVVRAHIKRIEAVNPVLNAVVAERFDAALEEARVADHLLATRGANQLPPLFGVPCSIKESVGLAGMPQCAGVRAIKTRIAEADSVATARLRAAGAIALGVTNISELCMWMESSNRVYGRTNNPYDPGCIVGGSSGGEGAIVSAAGTPFGLGSDIGGSIRMPAFFNGVFGHKPTSGLIPNTGQYPVFSGPGTPLLTTGPIARYAEDLWPLVRILAGPDANDPVSRNITLADPAEVDISSLRVVQVVDNGFIGVSPELQDAQERAGRALERLGARVETARFPLLFHSFTIWSSMLAESGESFSGLLGRSDARERLVQPFLWLMGRSPHTLPTIALMLTERVVDLFPGRVRAAVETGKKLREEISDRLGSNGVLLYPPYSRVAPRHDRPLLRPFDWIYTAIWNAMGFPATQVPLGLARSGLPLGVQVVGKHGADHVTVRVALELEREFGGWVPPARLASV